jgi:hypothetical protein
MIYQLALCGVPSSPWSTAADIFTVLGVGGALIGLAWQIRKSRQDTEFLMLQRLIDTYAELRQDTRDRWRDIREAIKSTPLGQEISDRTGSIDYLLMRVERSDSGSLTATEHGLIENEIRSLNLLNEICRLSAENESRKNLVRILLSDEIAFYQRRLEDLRQLRESESKVRRFSVMRVDVLSKYQVGDYFEIS